MSKISKKRYKELSDDLEYFEKEVAEIKEEIAEVSKVIDNCPICKGTGKVEDGYGNHNHNPYMNMLYRDCPKCKGFGYVK